MSQSENWSIEESLARCTETDRIRSRFARYFFGDEATQVAQYDLIFNTQRVPLDDVAAVAVAIVRGTTQPMPASSTRVLTLSRELGAGEQGFAPTLGERLGMQVYDRELLEQEAVRMGVPEAELEKIDERGAGLFQRFHPGSIDQRYFAVLGQLMRELAGRGDAILVGRGGSRILRDEPLAFHVRLVAPMPIRLRRVMEYRWVQEGIAKKLIAESDSRRSGFMESYFGADWSSPLEYDLTVNSGRLGPTAVEAVGLAAERHWGHVE
jgi:cytidylate kinase